MAEMATLKSRRETSDRDPVRTDDIIVSNVDTLGLGRDRSALYSRHASASLVDSPNLAASRREKEKDVIADSIDIVDPLFCQQLLHFIQAV
jgi:hypothetical protein